MSVLQVYLNWANSVLSVLGQKPCSGPSTIQEGKVVCQLIDILCPDAYLQRKAEISGTINAQTYLRSALDHMRTHGIKFHFSPQDILDGDIKSILDVLWLIILNYSIHSIGSSPYQRSVGIGKKLLLDWCQRELQEQFDPQNTLTYNLCTGDWFLKLLSKNSDRSYSESVEREQNLKTQLQAVEEKYGIRQALISPSDITEGTVDEHTLMIYISLLRLKVGDPVDALKSPSELSYQPLDHPASEDSFSSVKSRDIPAIVLSESQEKTTSPVPIKTESFSSIQAGHGTPNSGSTVSSPTHSPPTPKRLSEGTDPETSDWASQSSGSPLSSLYDKHSELRGKEFSRDAESLIQATISKHIENQIGGILDDDMSKGRGSRIPVRVMSGEESPRSLSSPGRVQSENQGDIFSRNISIKVQRPRSPNSIMAEARLKQEKEKEMKRLQKEESARLRKEAEKDETVMTGSASEGGDNSDTCRVRYDVETDPIKSDEDDIVKNIPKPSASPGKSKQMNGDIKTSVPVFMMPGQKHDMEVLLEALKHARTEAEVQDQLMQTVTASEQPDFKQVVDQNIEKLEAQLKAVKAQSKEIFEKSDSEMTPSFNMSRGRTPAREPHSSRRGECRSPPRGILDVMANQDIQPVETAPKPSEETSVKRLEGEGSPIGRVSHDGERMAPHGILRYRGGRSPTDHMRRFNEDFSEGRIRDGSHSPDKRRAMSPLKDGKDEQDPDKRLIKFLTNEIENLKLKMAVMEQKRSQSPHGMGPRITSGLPERERSPGQISSRARARFSDNGTEGGLSGYSPQRRCRSTDFLDDYRSRSRSPRFDRRQSRSRSRSPSHSPYRSRTPERASRERIRPISPRVLSLQDLSTSVVDDVDGKVTFAPASGARRVDLGYSSPIRKVNQEIWGYDQTEDDYYADTAKYESWKRLITRDTSNDEDMLEVKQALASALVELDILQAKVKNANSDIKEKMSKTTDVLNDMRAHVTKSQVENAELRAQNEREKSKSDEQELRIKEMEENLHSSKTTQDDHTLEMEESVLTLKGIINLDKNQMAQLEDENEKLRQKISDFQRENIKLKEDFNELKMYNDKAQTTIKDLKTCLEDAKKERKQLFTEISTLKSKGQTNTVSSIVSHYIEKGLYEEAEKDHMVERARSRSRSVSPMRFERARSTSPVLARSTTPVRTFSPIRGMGFTPSSRSATPVRTFSPIRSQTPTAGMFSYEDDSPGAAEDGHEIYPHRRTRSYVKSFGAQNEDTSKVDLNDPELQELLKPKPKLDYNIDLNDSYQQYMPRQEDGKTTKRQLLYSPYMDKDFVPKSQQNEDMEKDDRMKQEPIAPTSYLSQNFRKSLIEEDLENRKFIHALDSAVKESPAQLAQKQFIRDLDIKANNDNAPERWRSPTKGILKTSKSAHNMSIKENLSPRRSYDSRSYSPSFRTTASRSYSADKEMPRSYTPNTRSYSQNPPGTSYTSATQSTRSYSPGTGRNRSQSPGQHYTATHSGQRSQSTGNVGQRSYSPGDRYHDGRLRDSGYSTPTQSAGRGRSNVASDKGYNSARTPQSSRFNSKLDVKNASSPLLSEDERRYADLLIDKYTRQQFVGIPLASS